MNFEICVFESQEDRIHTSQTSLNSFFARQVSTSKGDENEPFWFIGTAAGTFDMATTMARKDPRNTAC